MIAALGHSQRIAAATTTAVVRAVAVGVEDVNRNRMAELVVLDQYASVGNFTSHTSHDHKPPSIYGNERGFSMKMAVIAVALLLSATAQADKLSLSGHWQNNTKSLLFLHHKTKGDANVWLSMAGKQVGFETGKMVILSPRDNITRAALYEINAKSDENVIVRSGGKVCEIKDLSFSLLGLLHQYGWRGRNMELNGIALVSGTMVCAGIETPWSVAHTGSWKRL
jgi:hypothetical protein